MAVAACALVLLGAASGGAETIPGGFEPIRFGGSLRPALRPPKQPVPVELELHFRPISQTGDLSRLTGMAVDLRSPVEVHTGGLPICPLSAIRGATTGQAKRTCGDAFVGRGNVVYRLAVPEQPPFAEPLPVLAFYGRIGDRRALLLHVDTSPFERLGIDTEPFVIRFVIEARPSGSGASLVAAVPPVSGLPGGITSFDLTLGRVYRNGDGEIRGFLSATCPVPPGVTSASFPILALRWALEDGTEKVGILNQACKARRDRPGPEPLQAAGVIR